MPHSALPEKLQIKDPATGEVIGSQPHWDWPWPFKLIPRGWTAFKWGVPDFICGTQMELRKDPQTGQVGPAPIGERGTWQLSRFPDGPRPWSWVPFYFAFTTKSGNHFRIGARWDDVDGYVQFPTIAWRHYSGGDDQDTSTK